MMHKAIISQLVDGLPNDVDVDEFVEKLYLLQKIELGEKQLADGEGIPHEEVKNDLKQWLE